MSSSSWGVDPPGGHALQSSWAFWFLRRIQGVKSQETYEKNMKKIGTFSTVEGFWSYYNHLIRPNDLPAASDYHMFKEGIKPMWEDEANKQGGKLIIRLRKGLASKCWEEIVLALIGEQFQDVGDEICGVVISTRFQEDILSIWNKNAYDREARSKIYDTVKAVLGNLKVKTEYKPHTASMNEPAPHKSKESNRPEDPSDLSRNDNDIEPETQLESLTITQTNASAEYNS